MVDVTELARVVIAASVRIGFPAVPCWAVIGTADRGLRDGAGFDGGRRSVVPAAPTTGGGMVRSALEWIERARPVRRESAAIRPAYDGGVILVPHSGHWLEVSL